MTPLLGTCIATVTQRWRRSPARPSRRTTQGCDNLIAHFFLLLSAPVCCPPARVSPPEPRRRLPPPPPEPRDPLPFRRRRPTSPATWSSEQGHCAAGLAMSLGQQLYGYGLPFTRFPIPCTPPLLSLLRASSLRCCHRRRRRRTMALHCQNASSRSLHIFLDGEAFGMLVVCAFHGSNCLEAGPGREGQAIPHGCRLKPIDRGPQSRLPTTPSPPDRMATSTHAAIRTLPIILPAVPFAMRPPTLPSYQGSPTASG